MKRRLLNRSLWLAMVAAVPACVTRVRPHLAQADAERASARAATGSDSAFVRYSLFFTDSQPDFRPRGVLLTATDANGLRVVPGEIMAVSAGERMPNEGRYRTATRDSLKIAVLFESLPVRADTLAYAELALPLAPDQIWSVAVRIGRPVPVRDVFGRMSGRRVAVPVRQRTGAVGTDSLFLTATANSISHPVEH